MGIVFQGRENALIFHKENVAVFVWGSFFFFFGHRYFNLITWVNYPCSSYLNPLPHSIILFFSSPIFCQSTDIILQSLLSVSFSRIKSPGGQRLCLVHCFIPSTCQMVGIINIWLMNVSQLSYAFGCFIKVIRLRVVECISLYEMLLIEFLS